MTTISDRDRAEVQAMFEAVFCPGVPIALSDDDVRRWLAVRDHVLAAHECQPVWRPVTFEEIQVGWDVRARRRDGSEASWGIAHHQDRDGDWFTEAGILLTFASRGWTYETTAPLPEPKPDPRIRVVVEWSNEPAGSTRDEAAVDLLARLDALTKGEQS